MPLSILFVGDAHRSEFRAAHEALQTQGQVTSVADVASAAALQRDGQMVPDVLVVAQAYPGQFATDAVERLRGQAPLARTVGLLGSWCEGETRTGKPWPAVVRVYWHQWASHADQQLRQMAAGKCSSWGLPVTATEEERLLQTAEQPLPRYRGLVGIYTRTFEMEDWLSAACRATGLSTVWLRPPHPARIEGAAVALFDGSDLRGGELDELRHLCESLAPTPVVTLLDLPRIEDTRAAQAAGAVGVVSKPIDLDDLFWRLGRVLATE